MTNAIIINLLARLEKVEYTHNYYIGFIKNGLVYAYTRTSAPTTGLALEKASTEKGGGSTVVRYRPKEAEKQALIDSGICEVICTEAFFLEMVANSRYNRGEIFEKIITEKLGLEWKKDNLRLDKGADVETGGIAYNIKFQKSTIASEKVLLKIENGE